VLKVWIESSRPKTLVAAFSPVLVAVALAYNDNALHFPSAFAALLGALFIQIGTNFANDFFDAKQGADTEDRKGPKRALHKGLITPAQLLQATAVVFLLAMLSCVYLVYRAGWPMLVLGLVSIACGIWYTAGSKSLAYTGLADIFAFTFFGPVAVAGTYYVQALTLPHYVVVAGVGVGCFSAALLTVNNLRDIDEDRLANKKTLAVRFGPAFARVEYISSLVVATLVPVVLVFHYGLSSYIFASFLFLLLAIPTSWAILNTRSPQVLNLALGRTAKSLLIYSVFLAGGILINHV